MADQTTSLPSKPAQTIIDATLPEPDFNDSHDGRFTGVYDVERGVVTVKFDRSEDPMDPEMCALYDVPDEGDGSVQLVERGALRKLLTDLGYVDVTYHIERVLFP